MILAGLLTVALLAIVSVMVWYCWDSTPIPATRLWALAFGGMSSAMLLQMWRAELWKKRFHRLAPPPQSLWLQSRSRRLLSQRRILFDAADRPSFLSVGIEFPALITRYGF